MREWLNMSIYLQLLEEQIRMKKVNIIEHVILYWTLELKRSVHIFVILFVLFICNFAPFILLQTQNNVLREQHSCFQHW